MADGILCKHCGWQETEHCLTDEEVNDLYEVGKVREGCKKTLLQCRNGCGYAPENPKMARKLARAAEQSDYEREMRDLDPLGE